MRYVCACFLAWLLLRSPHGTAVQASKHDAAFLAPDLECELLVSQVDDDDPIRSQPFVVCDHAGQDCVALTFRIQNSGHNCHELDVIARIPGVPHTSELTQRVIGADEGVSDIERPVWPELVPVLRQQLFRQHMQLAVHLTAQCAQVDYSNMSFSAHERFMPSRRITLEHAPSYPSGVPVLLSLADGMTAMQLTGDDNSVTAVSNGFNGCPNVSLSSSLAQGEQRPDNCTAMLFVNQREVMLEVTLALPLAMLPANAFNLTGAALLRISKPGSLALANRFVAHLRIDAPPGTPAKVYIAHSSLSWTSAMSSSTGASSSAWDQSPGVLQSSRSNVLHFVYDGQRPQPEIMVGRPVRAEATEGRTGLQVTMLLDYGERVMEINPLRLFNLSIGVRTDVVYEVASGKLWLTSFVSESQLEASGGVLHLWAQADAVTDVAGNGNSGVERMFRLPVTTDGAKQCATVVQVVVAVLLGVGAVCHVVLPVGSLQGPMPAAILAATLGLLLSAQQLYFSGMTAAPQLPGTFHTVADALDWTALCLRPWWMDSSVLDPNMAFPYPPVLYVAPRTKAAPRSTPPTITGNDTRATDTGTVSASGWAVVADDVQPVGQGWLVASNATTVPPLTPAQEQWWSGAIQVQVQSPPPSPPPPPPTPSPSPSPLYIVGTASPWVDTPSPVLTAPTTNIGVTFLPTSPWGPAWPVASPSPELFPPPSPDFVPEPSPELVLVPSPQRAPEPSPEQVKELSPPLPSPSLSQVPSSPVRVEDVSISSLPPSPPSPTVAPSQMVVAIAPAPVVAQQLLPQRSESVSAPAAALDVDLDEDARLAEDEEAENEEDDASAALDAPAMAPFDNVHFASAPAKAPAPSVTRAPLQARSGVAPMPGAGDTGAVGTMPNKLATPPMPAPGPGPWTRSVPAPALVPAPIMEPIPQSEPVLAPSFRQPALAPSAGVLDTGLTSRLGRTIAPAPSARAPLPDGNRLGAAHEARPALELRGHAPSQKTAPPPSALTPSTAVLQRSEPFLAPAVGEGSALSPVEVAPVNSKPDPAPTVPPGKAPILDLEPAPADRIAKVPSPPAAERSASLASPATAPQQSLPRHEPPTSALPEREGGILPPSAPTFSPAAAHVQQSVPDPAAALPSAPVPLMVPSPFPSPVGAPAKAPTTASSPQIAAPIPVVQQHLTSTQAEPPAPATVVHLPWVSSRLPAAVPAVAPGATAPEVAAVSLVLDEWQGPSEQDPDFFAFSPGSLAPSAASPQTAPEATSAPFVAPVPPVPWRHTASSVPFANVPLQRGPVVSVPAPAPSSAPQAAVASWGTASEPTAADSTATLVAAVPLTPTITIPTAPQLPLVFRPMAPVAAPPPPPSPSPPPSSTPSSPGEASPTSVQQSPVSLSTGAAMTLPPSASFPVFRGAINPAIVGVNGATRRRVLAQADGRHNVEDASQPPTSQGELAGEGFSMVPNPAPEPGPAPVPGLPPGPKEAPSASGGSLFVVTSLGASGQRLQGAAAVARIQHIQRGQLPGQNTQLYKPLEVVLFWAAILLGAGLLLSAFVLLLCGLAAWQVPLALFVPAPALLLWAIAMGPISYASAVLFVGDVGQILLGCVILLLLSFCPLLLLMYLLRRYTARRPSSRRTIFLCRNSCHQQLQRLPGGKEDLLVMNGKGDVDTKGTEYTVEERFRRGSRRGPRRSKRALHWMTSQWGSWMRAPMQDPWFASRFGMLYLPARGPALALTAATYVPKHPLTGWVDTPRMYSPSSHSRLPPIGSSHVYAVLLLLAKGMAVGVVGGCGGGSIQGGGGVAQPAVLLLCSVVQWAYWGMAWPWNCLTVQLAMMLAGTAEVILACCLLVASTQDAPDTALGTAVTASAIAGLACYSLLLSVLLVPYAVRALSAAVQGLQRLRTRGRIALEPESGAGERIVASVRQLFRQHPHLLQRKYADRWLMRVYGIGLYGRPARAWEVAIPRTPLLALGLTSWRRPTLNKQSAFVLPPIEDSSPQVLGPKVKPTANPSGRTPGCVQQGSGQASQPAFHSVKVGSHTGSESGDLIPAGRELHSHGSGSGSYMPSDSRSTSVPTDDVSFAPASFPGSVRGISNSSSLVGSCVQPRMGACGSPGQGSSASLSPRLSGQGSSASLSPRLTGQGSSASWSPRLNGSPTSTSPTGVQGGLVGQRSIPMPLNALPEFVMSESTPMHGAAATPYDAAEVGSGSGTPARLTDVHVDLRPSQDPFPPLAAERHSPDVSVQLAGSCSSSCALPSELTFSRWTSRARKVGDADGITSSEVALGVDAGAMQEQDRQLERAESGLIEVVGLLSGTGASGGSVAFAEGTESAQNA